MLQFDHRSEAAQLLENLAHVLADASVLGHQSDVGVQPAGGLVVIAGGQVGVAAQHAPFAAHDQQHLGVGLVADDAVDDLHARFLQAVGQADIRLLVEACAQLDDHRHFLAGSGGIGQVSDQGRILADAIQGLPDREHVADPVLALRNSSSHRRERFERVVQQHVAVADGLENVGVGREGWRDGWHEWRVFQLRAIDHVVDRSTRDAD